MIKKSLLGLMLWSFINSASAEMIAPGVELLSHRTWTTGNALSGYATVELDAGEKIFSSVNASVWMDSVYGLVDQSISTSASHSFSIENTSNQAQQYHVLMKVCAENTHCTYDSRNYSVDPQKAFSGTGSTVLNVSFSKPGRYILAAGTFISGGASASITYNAAVVVREKSFA